MLGLLGLLLLLLALSLSVATGVALGRVQERHKPLLSKAEAIRRREAAESAFETELRRSRGLPRVHPDPENAPVIRRARIGRSSPR